jgi:hypothetical protein
MVWSRCPWEVTIVICRNLIQLLRFELAIVIAHVAVYQSIYKLNEIEITNLRINTYVSG